MALTFAEARHWDRIPVEIPVTVLLKSDPCNVAHEAHTLDLSWSGARLRSNGIALTHGQVLDLVMAKGETMLRKLARVVWVGESGSGEAVEAGVKFVHPVAEA